MSYLATPPRQNLLGRNLPSLLPYVDRLGSGRCLVGRIGSGVRVSASFQKNSPPGSVLRHQKTELRPSKFRVDLLTTGFRLQNNSVGLRDF